MKADIDTHSPSVALLTTEEAAQLLHLKPRTLVLWRHEGRSALPFVRLGRSVRYRRQDLDEFIQGNVRVSVGP